MESLYGRGDILMATNIDLSQLAVKRDAASATRPRRRRIVTRYVLPGLVLAGFLAVLLWATRDSYLPSKPVTVVPVLATRTEVQQSGTPLFQSAGWVEPRPTPVVVTALSEGIVDQLLVVEGQEVKTGEPVARLIDADARLALQAAEDEQRMREAEAAALLAKAEADFVFLPFQLQAAESRQEFARIDLENKKSGGAVVIPSISMSKAESESAIAAAAVEELKVRKQRLAREVVSLKRFRDSSRAGATEHFEPPEPLTEPEANMKVAMARVRQAQTAVNIAKLRLERMTVRAPSSGKVLALVARPGAKLMGLTPGSLQDASTVVTLYDPQRLQIRADVRLDDVPRLQPGQPVRIETPAVPGKSLEGELLFATSITDIQKNTLQAKVSVKSPPPTLKPDMLVTATFLAPEPTGTPPATEQLRLFVPRQYVESIESGASIWVADQAAGKARLQSVKMGTAMRGDLVEIVEGLNAADKLIATGREGLRDGERITITAFESTNAANLHEHKNEPRRLPVAAPDAPGGKNK
jgi:RND family efflux transporter MFP subunit